MNQKSHQKHHTPKSKYQPFEDISHLKTLVKFELGGVPLVAALLSSAKKFDAYSDFEILIGFEFTPIHSGDQNLQTTGEQLAINLKSMPSQGRLTVSSARWADDRKAQTKLRQREAQAESDEHKMMPVFEQRVVKDMTQRGIRRETTDHMYVSIPAPGGNKRSHHTDPINAIIGLLQSCFRTGKTYWQKFHRRLNKTFHRLEGTSSTHHNKHLHRRLLLAYALAEEWIRFLQNNLALSVRPLSERELAQVIRQQFFLDDASLAAQLLIVTPDGIREEIRSRFNPALELTRHDVPQGNGRYIRIGSRWASIVTLAQKPGGWLNRVDQLRYLKEIQSSDGYFNTICLTQLSLANQASEALNLAWLQKQSRASLGHSIEQGDFSLAAEQQLNETEDAQRKLHKGERILRCATVFIVYRYTINDLETACEQLCSRFSPPALAVREKLASRSIWLQSLLITTSQLQRFNDSLAGQYFSSDFDRRLRLFTSEAVGFLPLLGDVSIDQQGLELITRSWTPYNLDFIHNPTHTFIAGATRSGKSLLESMRIAISLEQQTIPVIIVDYSSTFVDLCQFMGGAVYNILQESINLFEIPDTRGMSVERSKDIWGFWKQTVFSTLMIMTVGNQEETTLTKAVQSVLEIALSRFSQDAIILERFYQAYDEGIGSEAWNTVPTIHTFLEFCEAEQFQDLGDYAEKACELIRLAFLGWINKPGIGEAISQPSSFEANDRFTLFLLNGLGDDEGAAVMAALSQIAAQRVTAKYEACHFVLDEASVFMSYRWLNHMMGSLFAEGLKRGIFVDQIAQDISTTYRSPNGPKIFENIDTLLIGRIQNAARQSYTDYLRIPPDLIAENAQESYFPNPHDCYSNWLVVQSGRYTQCRWYASPFLLAIAANNPPERQARELVMQHYPNKFEGITAFAKLMMASIKSGASVLELAKQHVQANS